MTALLDALDVLAGRPLATVVHVNPVEPDLVQRYAALGARRVVLVSGDPDALPGLRRLLPGRPWLELVEAVVAPHAGDVHWLRYNVPSLNGLLEASGLHAFYPRLRLQERVPVQAQTLQTVLDGVPLDSSDGANVLVLEAPGLEDAMVRNIAATTLQRFEWLVIRGARSELLRDGAEPHAATRWLQAQAWRKVRDNDADEPLWPVTVLQFDAAAAEHAALMRRVDAAEAELRTLAAAGAVADKAIRDREAQIEALSQAKTEFETRAVELARQVAQAQAECVAMGQQATQHVAQIQTLSQAKAALEKSLGEQAGRLQQAHAERDAAKAALDKAVADRTQQVEQLGKARDEYAKQANERQKRIVQLDAELAELTARHALLQEELIKSEAHVELIADVLLRESLR